MTNGSQSGEIEASGEDLANDDGGDHDGDDDDYDYHIYHIDDEIDDKWFSIR